MRILVTGGNGFVGSHLVEALLRKGYQVRCLVRRWSSLRWIQGLDIRPIFGDVTDPDSLKDGVADVDCIYHLAGLTKAHHLSDFYKTNCLGTKNLIEACHLYNPGIKKFVFCSSLAAAGPSLEGIPRGEEEECHPVSDYGKSKFRAEEVLEQHMDTLPITIIRPPAIYGPRDRDTLNLFKAAQRGVLPLLGGRSRYVDICYVQDAVSGLVLAGEKNAAVGQTFFLTGGEIHSWEEIGDIISSVLHKKVRKVSLPKMLIDVTVLTADFFLKLTGAPPSLSHQKIVEMRQKYWICSSKKARTLLEYRPQTPLWDGIKETIDWYRINHWL